MERTSVYSPFSLGGANSLPMSHKTNHELIWVKLRFKQACASFEYMDRDILFNTLPASIFVHAALSSSPR